MTPPGLFSSNYPDGIEGILIYPPCAKPGGSLATGNIVNVLKDSSAYNSHSDKAIRDALAGGDWTNWEQFGGSKIYNYDTWPGMFSLIFRLTFP